MWRGDRTIPPPPRDLLRKVVSPALILPTVPDKWTQGDAASWGHSPLWPGNHWQWVQLLPARATWARRTIPGAKHSLGFCQSLWGCSIPKGSQSPLTRALQTSGTRFWASWAGCQKALESFSQLVRPNTALLFLPTLCSHHFSAWLSFMGTRFVWLCFCSQQSLQAVEYNAFLCGCADTPRQESWGQMGCGGHSLSMGHSCSGEGRVGSAASIPAALWAADVSILGKVKCLLTGALGSWQLCRAQPSCSSVLAPCCSSAVPSNHGTALVLLALPLQGWNPTPTKSIHSFDEGNNQKRKIGGKTNLTFWHLWHTDKNTKWQEVLFLKAIILLLSDHACVSSNPQQLPGSAGSSMAESCLHNMPSEQKAGLPPKIAATCLCFKVSLRETEVCGNKNKKNYPALILYLCA